MDNQSLMILLIAASLLFNVITCGLVIVLMRKLKENGKQILGSEEAAASISVESGVVFCRTCGNGYDSTMKVCPNCKTPR